MKLVIKMVDYKELYLKMFRVSEDAAQRLIAVQRECEELYISSQKDEDGGKIVPIRQKEDNSG
ncbi:MAG: hypothetical protein HDT38_05035 [Clostridiales bacterium]|nr:hypothetical protein [Clostridiales bacterium]